MAEQRALCAALATAAGRMDRAAQRVSDRSPLCVFCRSLPSGHWHRWRRLCEDSCFILWRGGAER